MGSVSVTSKSFEGRYFKFTVSQSGTSTTVNWTFEVIGGTGGLYYSTSPITLKINGVTVKSYSATAWSSYAFPAAKGSVSGTYNIGSYGSFKVLMSGNPNWSTAYDSEGTVTLDRPTYPVYYNTMGGSGTFNAQTKTYGINLKLHSHVPTKTGYTFKGWATSSGSTTVAYAAGATYQGNARLDLFAVWQANTYTVSYNANGGSGAPSSQTKTYGVNLTLSSTKPTRTNYIFKGWSTSSTSTTVSYAAGGTYTGNAALNLYAVWELAYSKPRITNYTVTRSTSDGTSDENGTYAKIDFKWATDKTVSSIKIEWKLSTNTSYSTNYAKTISASGTSGTVSTIVGDGVFSIDRSYHVRVTVTDSGGYSNDTRPISSIEFTLDLLAGGKGAAFGKAAEKEGLEVNWHTYINGNITMRNADNICMQNANGDTRNVMHMNVSDALNVGYGGYKAGDGSTNLYGNDVNIYSKNGINANGKPVMIGTFTPVNVSKYSFTSATDMTDTGYTLSIPAKSYVCITANAGYYKSKPKAVMIQLDNAWSEGYVANNNASTTLCKYVETASTLKVRASYDSAASNYIYVYGYYITV